MAWWRGASRTRQIRKAVKTRAGTVDRFCEIALTERCSRQRIAQRIAKSLSIVGIAIVLALAWALPAATAPGDFNHRKLAETAKTKLIVPGYRRFGSALANLRASLSKLCRKPDDAALRATRAAYRQAIDTWGRVEIFSFGPIVKDNRFYRIFYWPDRKGRAWRQVLQLLKDRDPTSLSAASLAKKSVDVQGLTALEIVLFGKTSEPLLTASDRGYSCKYAHAIAENLFSINESVVKEWTAAGDFAELWLNPGPNNPVYLSGAETTLELIKTLDLGIENVRDKRIAPILGTGTQRRKARPILWRSKSSIVLLHANIAALHDLLFQAGLSDAYIESKPNETATAKRFVARTKEEFDLPLAIFKELLEHDDLLLEPDVSVEIANRLLTAGFHLKEIRVNNIPEIKKGAGLVVGFNASDGD